MSASLHDVFHSTAFVVARDVALFVVAVFWLGLVYWTHRDARRRLDDPWLVATATLLAFVPVAGPLVYLLFRPPETLADVRAREVEVLALEQRLEQRPPLCPVCRTEVEPAFLICPVCTTRLREPCGTCGAPLERLWQACPYCRTVIAEAPSAADLDAALSAEAAGARNGSDPKAKPPSGAAKRARASS
jgi:hypothetical protein